MDSSAARFWTWFGIITMAVVFWLAVDYLAGAQATQVPPAPPAAEPVSTPASVVQQAMQAPAEHPAPPLPVPQADPQVLYKCQDGAKVVYSDQPCAKGQAAHILHTQPALEGAVPFRAPPPAAAVPDTKKGPAVASIDSGDLAKRPECKILEDEIKSIDAHMRERHTSEEANLYNQQRHRASNRRFDLHC